MKNNLKSLTAFIMTLIMLVNIFPISAFSAGNATMSLTVTSVSGEAGDTVEVDIVIADNPGIASLKFDVAYDSALTLQGVEFNPAFGPYATTPPAYKNPQKITLVSPYSDVTANGVFATLTFKIADNASAGKYNVSVTYAQNETYNSNFDDVAVNVVNGSVTVESAAPESMLNLTVGEVSGKAGETVKVDVSITDNPGIASLKFDVAYDSALTLQGVEFNPAFGPYATTPPTYKNPQKITLVSPYSDVTANGVFATLTFKIAGDAAEGNYGISVTYAPNETYNSNFDSVGVNVSDGFVTVVTEPTIPDVDIDGDVDKTDAEAILKYITGHAVDVNEDVIDVNGDGEVNIRDAAAILLYLKSLE